jgi:hypothetical protein
MTGTHVLHGRPAAAPDEGAPRRSGRRSWWRRGLGALATVLAALLVWFALVAPDSVGQLTPAAFVRVPLEGLLLAVLLVLLPPRARRVTALVVGLVLALLTVVRVFDLGFTSALGRPFDPLLDKAYLGSAVSLLSDSVGHTSAVAIVVAAVVVTVVLVVGLPLSVLRLSRVLGAHRTPTLRAAGVLSLVWVVCAVLGLQVVAGAPLASTGVAALVDQHVRQGAADLRDSAAFARAQATDAFRGVPAQDLLTGLRGKDVIVAFVESYGQVAVQGTSFSPGVDAVLRQGTQQLAAAGFHAKSAFLTSPTFGGISWLAHSTLQTGLWVDSQQRYDDVVSSDRFTLSDAFKDAGWRTVADVPSNTADWPEGRAFYHYDTVYGEHDVGYRGPKFSYATMPDQYVLAAFQRLELARPDRKPVLAEIDLVSSHTPWAPLPRMVPWSAVGDGSVFDGMPQQGQVPSEVWRHQDQVRAAYGRSVQYTLSTLVSFVRTYPDPNLVLVVLGDHQPSTTVSGDDANHDVPVSVVAHDPSVLARIAGWGWQDGLLPAPNAPVWPMDAFRDRFLAAYSTPQR